MGGMPKISCKTVPQFRWMCFNPEDTTAVKFAENWGFVYEHAALCGKINCPDGWLVTIEKRDQEIPVRKKVQIMAYSTLHRNVWADHVCTATKGEITSCICLQDIHSRIKEHELLKLFYKMLTVLQMDVSNLELQPLTVQDITDIRRISTWPFLGPLELEWMELLSLGETCYKHNHALSYGSQD